MSRLIEIARAVAKELSEQKAEMLFYPEFELRDLEKLRVVVIPIELEFEASSREAHVRNYKVSVGILQRAEKEVEKLVSFAESLGTGFLYRELAGAVCVEVVFNPVFSAEHLRERGQFTSVVELTFREVE